MAQQTNKFLERELPKHFSAFTNQLMEKLACLLPLSQPPQQVVMASPMQVVTTCAFPITTTTTTVTTTSPSSTPLVVSSPTPRSILQRRSVQFSLLQSSGVQAENLTHERIPGLTDVSFSPPRPPRRVTATVARPSFGPIEREVDDGAHHDSPIDVEQAGRLIVEATYTQSQSSMSGLPALPSIPSRRAPLLPLPEGVRHLGTPPPRTLKLAPRLPALARMGRSPDRRSGNTRTRSPSPRRHGRVSTRGVVTSPSIRHHVTSPSPSSRRLDASPSPSRLRRVRRQP